MSKELIVVYQMAKVGSSAVYVKLRGMGLDPMHFHWINNTSGLKSLMPQFDQASFKIITIARDPISRNISRFWSRQTNFNLGHATREFHKWIKTDRVLEPLTWFDTQLKKYFNIDVYQKLFPQDQGYGFYQNNSVEVLVLRTESLNKAPEAISQFLNIDCGPLQRLNTGACPGRYVEFKKNLKIPKKHLDKMYKSKYARHFYTKDEIESFYRKWL